MDNIESRIEELKQALDKSVVDDKGFLCILGTEGEGDQMDLRMTANHMSKENIILLLKEILTDLEKE